VGARQHVCRFESYPELTSRFSLLTDTKTEHVEYRLYFLVHCLILRYYRPRYISYGSLVRWR